MNKQNIYFTSDSHLGHANVIKHDNRPFSSIEAHDEHLINQWNSVVRDNDTIYHLGDVCFRCERDPKWYLDRLNGKIHLIKGNHDRGFALRYPERFESISDLLELKIHGQKIVLCHYAMRTWNGSHHGSWLFYGHSHGMLNPWPGSIDLGTNIWNYTPVSFAELAEQPILKEFTGVDHHTKEADHA